MKLTRRVTFSSGHRYWLTSLSEAENRARFGVWASPYNHGHNYVLDVTTEGDVDPETGMVINIKRIDDLLKTHIVHAFDQRSLNDEVPAFRDQPSTLENLLYHIAAELGPLLQNPARLTHLRLEEMPTLWAELDLKTNMTTLTRTYEFAASHRLHVESMSQAENDELFGKCNNPAGHGHNYLLEVTVSGSPDPLTGMLVDLGALDDAVNRLVVDRYDHRNLNCDVPELVGQVTTSEVVSQAIWNQLNGKLPAPLYRVRLHETARNIFEVTA